MTLENFIYESVSEILNGGYEEVKKDIKMIQQYALAYWLLEHF